jgi:ketosteroid isomerase-like protein
MKNSVLWTCTTALGATVAALSGVSFAAPPTAQAQSRAAVESVLHSVESAMARGDTAEKVSKMLYADDVVITEDEPGSMRGITAATQGVQGFFDALGPGGGKGCKFNIIDPVVASSTTFSSFLFLSCKANPPVLKDDLDMRLTYTWKKLPQGWRVVLETVQAGKF